MDADVISRAQRLSDDVLFPRAIETDEVALVPVANLDFLAEAGLYGLAGPADAGGLGLAEMATGLRVIELLAGGCLTTTFVWMQHHGAVRALTDGAAGGLRDEWLEPLCRGVRRAGVAFSGLRRPGPPVLTARPAAAGWTFDGFAAWVTGWGRVQVIHTAARDLEGRIVWALVDAIETPSLVVEPLRLAAVNASATVTLRFHDLHVPSERVTLIQDFEEWRQRDGAGLRVNGSLALGIAGRCLSLLGPSALDAELVGCRESLDQASVGALPAARSAASDLAMRAASTLVVAGGGRSILATNNAQRLAREALFLLVFGQTAAIKAVQLDKVGVAMAPPGLTTAPRRAAAADVALAAPPDSVSPSSASAAST